MNNLKVCCRYVNFCNVHSLIENLRVCIFLWLEMMKRWQFIKAVNHPMIMTKYLS